MFEFEPFYAPGEISRMYQGTLTAASIRDACHRSARNHPLPHIKSGTKRPVIKIRPSVFERWLAEEMGIDEAVAIVDRRAGRCSEGVR